MKIGIMQPYFFPYLGYFSLIKQTDRFVLLDEVQFIRHGWIERNRVLKPHEGWQYISVPLVKQSSKALIKDTLIDHSQPWQKKLLSQLSHYKKKSPYYKQTIEVLEHVLNQQTESITQLNYQALKATCEYLNLPFNCDIFSEMNTRIDEPLAADEWALNIAKALGYEEYWNPIGGAEFFNPDKYKQAHIKLVFHECKLDFYSQRRGVDNFEAGLSIIDAMMFNAPEEIREMLDRYITH